ncbi:hypothetical protein ANO11243_063650 [Dothideomycetidae sp. 11243]|nr:hypothetical protein ANO11243_063650 [fungal sp. No.11243]
MQESEDEQASDATPVQTPARSGSLHSKRVRNSVEQTRDNAAPASAQQMRARIESTPLAGDTSIAALKNFRRRPRQPSLLHMVQNPDETLDSSELGLDTTVEDNAPPASAQQIRARIESTPAAGDTSVAALANFRRRPRQPSLLHMVQNPDESLDNSELDLDTTLGTMDSPVFAPDDEGTPQPQSRAPNAQPSFLAPGVDDDDLYTVSPRPKHGRKRKSHEISDLSAGNGSEIEVERSQTPTRMPQTSSSLSDPLSSPALPEATSDSHGTSTPRRIDPDSDTFADPLSSSPLTSPISSPVKAAPAVPRNAQKKAALTTAMLRALLPRRQNRMARRSNDSSDDENEDDIDNSEFRTDSRRRKTKAASTGRKVLGEVKGRRNTKVATVTADANGKGSVKTRTIAATGKENDDGTGARSRARKGTVTAADRPSAQKKTYSRRSEPEPEDEEEDEAEDEEGDGDVGLSKELQAARDKFKRIDEAELEFESASLGGGSSPWR